MRGLFDHNCSCNDNLCLFEKNVILQLKTLATLQKLHFLHTFLTVSLKLYPYEKTSIINLHILQQTFLEPIVDQMTRCHLNSFICLTKLALRKAQEFIADLKQHC